MIAERLGGARFAEQTAVNKFATLRKIKTEAIRKKPHLALIDMGEGDPDTPADPRIVKVLAEEAGKSENRRYAFNGVPEFQEAAAGYLEQVYGVKGLEVSKQILHGIGSKSILGLLPMCLINPGDVTLMTTPGYPITAIQTRYLGGEVYNLPLWEDNDFFPDLHAIPGEIARRAKLLYINYPNNPTGRVATRAFFESVVEFALQNDIQVLHDATYASMRYDGARPLSFLNIEGADQVGVEVHSLSKMFSMTGWRLAFVAGKTQLIQAYGVAKNNTDCGQFRAIQKAGAFALKNPQMIEEVCSKYSRRFDLLVSALNNVGFSASKPKATLYSYVRRPSGTATGRRFASATDFVEFLLKEALIATVPWDEAGEYVRFSVTFEAETPEAEKVVIHEMQKRLARLDLAFEE